MFFKKSTIEEAQKLAEGYEEQEQKTPKAGYILLIFMFMAATFFGWRAIDDLQEVPARPEQLSQCAYRFLEYDWEDYGRYRYDLYSPPEPAYEPYMPKTPKRDECIFSSFEIKHGVPNVFEKRKARDLELNNLELELQKVSASIYDYERQYALGLEEKIAEEQRKLYPIPEIQQNLENLRKQKADLEIRIDKIRAELKPLDDELKSLYREVMKAHRWAYRWYEFKVFLLEAIFVFPFFWFVFWMYKKLLAKNSPYTIIFTALIGVASVLVLKILLVWFWSLFLARIIETLWNFIKSFALLKSLVLYGGMFLSIAIFGGAVYILQKRIFAPKRVALRRLRQKQCPNCQTSLDLAEDFCPNCGRKLKNKCSVCGKDKWVDLQYCQHCSNKP